MRSKHSKSVWGESQTSSFRSRHKSAHRAQGNDFQLELEVEKAGQARTATITVPHGMDWSHGSKDVIDALFLRPGHSILRPWPPSLLPCRLSVCSLAFAAR